MGLWFTQKVGDQVKDGIAFVKLPAQRAGLPGNVLSYYIVPLDPAYPAIGETGHLPVKETENSYDLILVDFTDSMGPAQGLFQLNFYQNIHVRLERWKGQTCYDNEEVNRSAFSLPSFIKDWAA